MEGSNGRCNLNNDRAVRAVQLELLKQVVSDWVILYCPIVETVCLLVLTFNVTSYHSLLLKAEWYRNTNDVEKAKEAYEASICLAKEHKFINEEALACELAGYFFEGQGESVRSKEMLQDAYDAYMKWGANAKSEMLHRKHLT